jgi:N-acyl-L-homoserine lactone synthetase
MLHILRSGVHSRIDGLLKNMFASRKRVFVDLLKWNVPVLDGQFEIDQFDDEHAVYLIVADDDGRHLASARLLPSVRPHILGDLFPTLADHAVPIGIDTWEITRFCLDRALTARERRDARDALVVGLVEHALSAGIARYTAIAGIGWVQQILAFGWECWPLGVARELDGETLAALEIHIDTRTPRLLADAGITDRLNHAEALVAA